MRDLVSVAWRVTCRRDHATNHRSIRGNGTVLERSNSSMRLFSYFVFLSLVEGLLPLSIGRRISRHASPSSGPLHVASKDGTTQLEEQQKQEDRDAMMQNFLVQARKLGPVGIDRTEEERLELLTNARAIAKFSDPSPAQYPLSGVHSMVYSAAPGSSSGKLFGPVNGKVLQEYVDDVTFINSVELGPLKIALHAERTVMDDSQIKVTFKETSISLFGSIVANKKFENNRGGVWKYLFIGEVMDPAQGQRKLVRVMETPSLFILEQNLD